MSSKISNRIKSLDIGFKNHVHSVRNNWIWIDFNLEVYTGCRDPQQAFHILEDNTISKYYIEILIGVK